MKALKKMVVAIVLALIALSAVSLLTGSASTASGLSGSASISSGSNSVGAETSYTLTITNTGPADVGSVNITVSPYYSHIENLAVTQPTGQGWTATLKTAKSNYYIIIYGSTQALAQNQSLTLTFDAKNPTPTGTYKWVVGVNENTATNSTSVPQTATATKSVSIVISDISAAVLILIIAAGIAALNVALNRILINYFIGWEQYRVMQKEMNEYRKETMAAARANDKKQMERLKKRQSQINNMQSKMLKPQMVQLGVSFLYIFVWIFVLTPTYGLTSLVYLPGIGALSVVYWYPVCSFFLGLLASRILGIMPIEP